ncbi:unnamed protein product [Amoebophrya sp. A25]|nr:unnamed protein product [Amoebophrya sp. A25]|eukprot:GSA25T00009863001.1
MDLPLELQKYIVPVITESLKMKKKRFVMIQGPPDSGKTSSLLISLLAVYAFPEVGLFSDAVAAAQAATSTAGAATGGHEGHEGPAVGVGFSGTSTAGDSGANNKGGGRGNANSATTTKYSSGKTTSHAGGAGALGSAALSSGNGTAGMISSSSTNIIGVSGLSTGVVPSGGTTTTEYLSGAGGLNTIVLVYESMEKSRKFCNFAFGAEQTTFSFVDGTPNDHSTRFTNRAGPYYPRVLYGHPSAVLSLLRGNLNRSSNLRPSSGNGVDLRDLEVFILDDAEKLIQNDCMDDVCEILQICKFFSRKKLRFIILSGYILSNHFFGSNFSTTREGAGEFGSGFWNRGGTSSRKVEHGAGSSIGASSRMLSSLTNKGQKQHSSMLRSLRNSLIKGQNLFGLRKDQIRTRARRWVKHYAVVARRKRWAKLLADLHKTLSLPLGVIFLDQARLDLASTASTSRAGGPSQAAGVLLSNMASPSPADVSQKDPFQGDHKMVVKGSLERKDSSCKDSGAGSGASTPSHASSSKSRGFKSNAELVKMRSVVNPSSPLRNSTNKPAAGGNKLTGEKASSSTSNSKEDVPSSSSAVASSTSTLAADAPPEERSKTLSGNQGEDDAKDGATPEIERDEAATTGEDTAVKNEVDRNTAGGVAGAEAKNKDQDGAPTLSAVPPSAVPGSASAVAGNTSPPAPAGVAPATSSSMRMRMKPKSAAERARELAKQQSLASSKGSSNNSKEQLAGAASSSVATTSQQVQQASAETYQDEVALLEELLHGQLAIHPTLDTRNAAGGCDFFLTPSNPIILRAEVPKGLRCVVHLGVLETHLYGLRLLALQISGEEQNTRTKGDGSQQEHAISLLFVEPDDANSTMRDIENELDITIQVIPNELLPT